MNLLLTAGGTREAVDAVRFLGNRSSGRMGAAVAAAAVDAGHQVTVVAANVAVPLAGEVVRIESAEQLRAAVIERFADCDALVMAAAVADFRPVRVEAGKLRRGGNLTIECEPTPDVLAEVAATRRPGQVIVGFSLDEDTDEARQRAAAKLAAKGCDLLVFNPLATMDADEVRAELLWAGGRAERLGATDKGAFGGRLVGEVERLVAGARGSS